MEQQSLAYKYLRNSDTVQKVIFHDDSIYKEITKHTASSHGRSGSPPCKGGVLISFVETITADYNALLAKVYKLRLSSLHLNYGKATLAEFNEENAMLEKDLAPKEKEHAVRNLQLGDAFPFFSLFACIVGFLSVVLMAAGDAAYLARSLQAIMQTLFGAIALAIAISLGLLAIGHFAPGWIASFSSKLLRRVVSLAIVLAVCILFATLGHYRSEYIFEKTGKTVSPWPFVLVNLLLFLAISLVARFVLLPALEGLKPAIHVLKSVLRNNRLKRQIRRIKARQALKKQELSEYLKDRMATIFAHKADEEQIRSLYAQAIALYKETVAFHLGYIPDCFSDATPQLKSFTDDIKL